MKTLHWVIIGVIVLGIVILALTGKANTSRIVTLGFLALCPLIIIFISIRPGQGVTKKIRVLH